MVFKKIKNMFSSPEIDKGDEEYLEIDLGQEKKDDKVLIKLYVLKQYEDVNEILNSLREGYTIAIIDISVLRKKDSYIFSLVLDFLQNSIILFILSSCMVACIVTCMVNIISIID